MKIRNGFVSNSSSSSFIVSCDGDANIELSISVDLSRYGKVIKTISDLDEFFLEETCVNSIENMLEDEYQAKRYNKCKKSIDQGKTIILGSFSSDADDALEKFLCENGISKLCKGNVQCIEGEGGY